MQSFTGMDDSAILIEMEKKMTRIQNAEAEDSLISILKKTKSTTLQFYASVDQ